MMRPILILAFLLGLAAAAGASPSREALDRATRHYRDANAAYEKSDYAEAAALYRRAIDEGAVSSRLYYNYANSLFRLKQLGMAILYYEKARKLAPDDEDIAYNLRFANAQTIDKNPVPEANVFARALWVFHSAYTINQGLWAAALLFGGIFLAATLALFAGSALRGLLITAIGFAVLGLAALVPSLAYKVKQQETLEYAIVISPTLEMYSGPGDTYQVLTKVHEGTKFEIVEVQGEWASVKLLNGKGGYVRLADLGKV